MSQLDAILQAIAEDAQAAAEAVALSLASQGSIVDAPDNSLGGVNFAWEQLRRFWNGGAGAVHNRLQSATDRLRRMS